VEVTMSEMPDDAVPLTPGQREEMEKQIKESYEKSRSRKFKSPINIIVEVPDGKPIHLPKGQTRYPRRPAYWEIKTIGDITAFWKDIQAGKCIPNPPLEIQLMNIFAEFMGLIDD
jgi:hypothetical protein